MFPQLSMGFQNEIGHDRGDRPGRRCWGNLTMDSFNQYMVFYQKYAINWWNHIGPAGYLTLLSLVGIIGYLTMLKGPKRL
jgi:hypothetical protein